MGVIRCVFAGLLLRAPLFNGATESGMVNQIFDMCGTPTRESWPGFSQLPMAGAFVMKPRAAQVRPPPPPHVAPSHSAHTHTPCIDTRVW